MSLWAVSPSMVNDSAKMVKKDKQIGYDLS